MNRRTFLCGLTLGALAAPLAAEAQQAAKVARIGILTINLAAAPHNIEAFLQGLRDLGYVEGRNVAIEYRDARGGRSTGSPRLRPNWSRSRLMSSWPEAHP
jgi:putative ABC transport system substrate-binding protein